MAPSYVELDERDRERIDQVMEEEPDEGFQAIQQIYLGEVRRRLLVSWVFL